MSLNTQERTVTADEPATIEASWREDDQPFDPDFYARLAAPALIGSIATPEFFVD